MDYKAYAPHFDELCAINPAYDEMISLFKAELDALHLPPSPRAIDVGAGTGNFVCALLEQIPRARVMHLDCSHEMNEYAEEKYRARGFCVQVVEEHMQTVGLDKKSMDLVVCVNALNNAPPVRPIVNRILSWLKPGGYFFLIDFGREMDVIDWTWFLFKNLVSTVGVGEAIKVLRRQTKTISINRKGHDDQQAGKLWTHNTQELLDLLEGSGFEIVRTQLCYRDYADLVVARRPDIAPEAKPLTPPQP